MENLERFGYPLIVVAAVATLWYALKRGATVIVAGSPSSTDHSDASGGIGLPPQYLADPRSLPLTPEYIALTTSDPYSPASPPGTGSPYANSPAGLASTSQAGQNLNPLLQAYDTGSQTAGSGSGKCGCSGSCEGCKPKCKTDCGSNVRFTDGRGSCIGSDVTIAATAAFPMQYYGVAANSVNEPIPA